MVRLCSSLRCVVLLSCALLATPSLAAWDVVVKYDGPTGPHVKKPAGTNVSSQFTRGKPTVRDDGVPVGATVRRFASKPVGVAGHVNWQPALSNLGAPITLGPIGKLLGSGPDYASNFEKPLLVAINPQIETLYVFELNGNRFTQRSATSWAELPGSVPNSVKYIPRSACVWYGLIVVYAERNKLHGPPGMQTLKPEGITIFYSEEAGLTWSRLGNTTGGLDVPANAVAAGADVEIIRGEVWAGPRAFPVGGIDGFGNFSKVDVFFPWTDYLNKLGHNPRGYQTGLFRATWNDDEGFWDIKPNRVIAERWEPAGPGGMHGHTAHVVDGGVVVWYGDASWNNGADFIGLDLQNYETSAINVTPHWHGGVETAPPAAGWPVHARNSLQPVSAAPGPGGGVLMAGDTFYEPVLRLENTTSAASEPQLSPLAYMVNDRNFLSGLPYMGWETIYLHWYPHGGWFPAAATRQ